MLNKRRSDVLNKLIKTQNDFVGLVLRVTLGVAMFPHGAQKAFGWFGGFGLSGTLEFFGSLGIPVWLGVPVIAAELLGSVALVVGLFGRVAALAVAAVMFGAVVTVHLPNGFFMNWSGAQAGEGFEYHLLVLPLTAVLALNGSGAFSIDRWLSQTRRHA